MITGIPRFGDDQTLLNSAIMLSHEGKIKGIYNKRHLVPFGEYIPFREWLPFLYPIVGAVDFSAGQNNALMQLEGIGTMQLLICYEVIFSGEVLSLAMRPDLMVNITNDAWFEVQAHGSILFRRKCGLWKRVCRCFGLQIRHHRRI